jgi:uncharacterized protein YndB with AHSA1/START domain
MIGTIPAVRREVVVGVPPERAFAVFTERMTDWWPSHHHIGATPIEQVVVEPREGGRWYTRHEGGGETSTGFVTAWEPPERLVLTWQIGADWRYHADLVTTVELRFTPEGEGRTRVTLEHRDLERFGPDAERMRQTFDAPDAWQATLAGYAAAAGGAA